MSTIAVVLEAPERLALSRLELEPAGPDDVVVDVEWSGISTGTERLFWSGRMPPFPGMGYPLVPGYETVGRVVAGSESALLGQRVFVPGARCFGAVRGLFGGAASRLVVKAARAVPVDERLGEEIAAFVSLAPGSAVTGEQLQAFAAERLARYKQPREVTVLDGLPKNATGKILRRELRDPPAPE